MIQVLLILAVSIFVEDTIKNHVNFHPVFQMLLVVETLQYPLGR